MNHLGSPSSFFFGLTVLISRYLNSIFCFVVALVFASAQRSIIAGLVLPKSCVLFSIIWSSASSSDPKRSGGSWLSGSGGGPAAPFEPSEVDPSPVFGGVGTDFGFDHHVT